MLKRISQMVESVARFLGEHIDEFHRGDVIAEIGGPERRIVLGVDEMCYYVSYNMYKASFDGINELMSLGTGSAIMHERAERDYVKIDHWNGHEMEGGDGT